MLYLLCVCVWGGGLLGRIRALYSHPRGPLYRAWLPCRRLRCADMDDGEGVVEAQLALGKMYARVDSVVDTRCCQVIPWPDACVARVSREVGHTYLPAVSA